MAIDEINKAGGVAGMPIEPVIVDAKSDFNVYSEKTKELILRNKVVSIFGCYTSASRKAILPTVMAQDHLLYYPTCYEGAECTQNTICTGPLANQHSKDLIPYMVEQFGKKVFFVGSNYVWPKESNKNAKIWLQKAGGELLFDVLSARHERAATIITSNLAFSEWNRVFGDDKLTAALLDRLGQHADVLVTRGPGDRVPHAVKRSQPDEETAPTAP